MSVRRNNDKKYDELEQQPTGASKKEEFEIKEHYRLQEQDNFIRKGYLLCLLLFLATGVLLITVVLEGTYRDSIIAEQILISLGRAILNKSILSLFKSMFIPDQPDLYNKKVLLLLNG